MSEVETVLAALRAIRFVKEQPPGSNRGQGVEAMQQLVSISPGSPWCAACVAWAGQSALGKKWPLPLTGGCAALGDFAKQKKVLMPTPQVGDVFLLYFPSLKRFGHTGFITGQAEGSAWTTIEGNAADPSQPSSREGYGVFQRTRTFGASDRFIQWTALL